MNITKHHTVLLALEKRALRYKTNNGRKQVDWDDVLYEDALDENGTVSKAGLTDEEEDHQTIATDISERVEIEGVTDEVLLVHGIAPGKIQRGLPN